MVKSECNLTSGLEWNFSFNLLYDPSLLEIVLNEGLVCDLKMFGFALSAAFRILNFLATNICSSRNIARCHRRGNLAQGVSRLMAWEVSCWIALRSEKLFSTVSTKHLNTREAEGERKTGQRGEGRCRGGWGKPQGERDHVEVWKGWGQVTLQKVPALTSVSQLWAGGLETFAGLAFFLSVNSTFNLSAPARFPLFGELFKCCISARLFVKSAIF